ncbi:putative membrane protein [Halobacteriovorax marinus SJ]|uniref:Membrane protein n=1 Tax=Halobacteriovorax marinus (strain ATCC BAA-682 / DSM 15412 / SJ) TaxID=862908 RepID=E1X1V3_HALMS|nr:hypothetical protein [Halobacteriovorax marinus]CBW26613.1 putative membrane protein [Halobacteriovorax marinus SJ]
MLTYIKAFAAGFLSTLVFHQGLFGLFYLAGLVPRAPFNMTAVPPLGVPSIISLSFFGGLWGIIIWRLISSHTGAKHWFRSLIFGAIGPSAVALLIVFPLKGVEVSLIMIPFALILNGAWGIGVSLFMKFFK